MKAFNRIILASLATCTLASGWAHAQYRIPNVGSMNKDVPAYAEGEVGVDEKLGATVTDALTFTDENGAPVQLKTYLHQGRPIILWLGYYDCPMLCDKMSEGMVESVKDLKLDAGREFAIVNVSIDPGESPGLASAKKKTYLKEIGQPGNATAWNLLTGSPDSILTLCSEVGYKFKEVEIKGEKQFAHPAVLVILDQSGKVTRYVYPDGARAGIGFDPQTMRLALIEAGDGKVGSVMDRVLMTCLMGWDGTAGKYTASVQKLMMLGGAVTVVAMAAVLLPLWVRAARGKDRPGNVVAA